MKAWIVIAVTDLNDYLVSAQLSVLRTVALAAGQDDPFTAVMHGRADYIRNRLSGRVQLSQTAYAIPPELKTQACYLIIEAMQVRLPALRLTEDQRNAIARSYKDLDIAGTIDLPISTAADAAAPDVQGENKGAVSVVTTPTRRVTRDDLKGL